MENGKMKWNVYVILCMDGSLYTGSTNNLEKRFLEHEKGKGGKYTRSHKPLKLIYSEIHQDKSSALKREIEIKSWAREKKIKELNIRLEG
jgi:putative endonuclease